MPNLILGFTLPFKKGMDFFNVITQIYKSHGNDETAIKMAAYMKNKFPFYGIKKPLRKEISTDIIKPASSLPFAELEKLILALWNAPERENQYFALEVLDKSRFWKQEKAIALIEFILTQKSWWDTVDAIASKFVGNWFLAHPQKRDFYIDKWMASDNMWLHRTCIIFQLKYRHKIDIALLKACIEPHLESKEFFIQKAIGWSLRQLAKTHPQETVEITQLYPLKPLSKREALKNLQP